MPNGTYTTYTYSTRSWLTAIVHKKSDNSTFLSISYEFDETGNPTKATENNGDVTHYTYDDLYRLTRETKKDSGQETLYDYSYTYDAVGNRTRKRDEVAQSNTDSTYNNMNQLTAAGNITYTYDDAGNMATKVVNQQTTTYSWDFRSKMLKVDFPSGDDPVMRYDGEGTRAKKVVGSTTTVFLYDVSVPLPALLFETDGSLNEVAEYRRDPGGALVAMQRSSTLYWYHFDHLGSTRALTNSSETVTDTYRYDAWGEVTASTGSTTNRLRFVGMLGYYDDPDVGLTLLGAQYYDRGVGRFASADPRREGLNLYVYVRNAPLTYADPSGESAWDIIRCVGRWYGWVRIPWWVLLFAGPAGGGPMDDPDSPCSQTYYNSPEELGLPEWTRLCRQCCDMIGKRDDADCYMLCQQWIHPIQGPRPPRPPRPPWYRPIPRQPCGPPACLGVR